MSFLGWIRYALLVGAIACVVGQSDVDAANHPSLIRYKDQVQISTAHEGGSTSQIRIELAAHTKSIEQLVMNRPELKRQVIQSLWLVNGTIADLTADQIVELRRHPRVQSVRLLRRRARLVDFSDASTSIRDSTYGLKRIRVPDLRFNYPGVLGAGVSVGIIDTGIDARHLDLKDRLKLFKDFTSAKSPAPADGHGHGTHVAGTIAGGEVSGLAIGVAPEVQLVIGRVFDSRGDATESIALQAMQWIADPDGNPQTNDFPSIVSNSWEMGPIGKGDPSDDPLCIAVSTWNKLGMMAVFAAGNSGPRQRTIAVPGACPESVTVGATDQYDQIASFSSRGPVFWKSKSYDKPNISAPGVDVLSADRGGGYRSRSGTSMAAPHIAGLLALLKSAKPSATIDELTSALYVGAVDLGRPGPDTTYGVGRADALSSVQALIEKSQN